MEATDGRAKARNVGSTARVAELALSGWLLMSTVLFVRSPVAAASALGAAILAGAAAAAAFRLDARARVGVGAVGLWLVAAFWLVYAARVSAAALNDLVVGTLLALSSLMKGATTFSFGSRPPAATSAP